MGRPLLRVNLYVKSTRLEKGSNLLRTEGSSTGGPTEGLVRPVRWDISRCNSRRSVTHDGDGPVLRGPWGWTKSQLRPDLVRSPSPPRSTGGPVMVTNDQGRRGRPYPYFKDLNRGKEGHSTPMS